MVLNAEGKSGLGHSITLDAEGRRRRARAAALARHQPEHPAVAAWRVEAAERYIRELVDSFPPLTAGQRARLATILHPRADDAAAT
jgi:predicted kinase